MSVQLPNPVGDRNLTCIDAERPRQFYRRCFWIRPRGLPQAFQRYQAHQKFTLPKPFGLL